VKFDLPVSAGQLPPVEVRWIAVFKCTLYVWGYANGMCSIKSYFSFAEKLFGER